MEGSFLTRRFSVACYILAALGPMPDVQNEGNGRVTFCFKDPDSEWMKANVNWTLTTPRRTSAMFRQRD